MSAVCETMFAKDKSSYRKHDDIDKAVMGPVYSKILRKRRELTSHRDSSAKLVEAGGSENANYGTYQH